MQYAFGELRLSPQSFWSMTLRELHHAMRANAGSALSPPERSDLVRLMQKYPDRS